MGPDVGPYNGPIMVPLPEHTWAPMGPNMGPHLGRIWTHIWPTWGPNGVHMGPTWAEMADIRNHPGGALLSLLPPNKRETAIWVLYCRRENAMCLYGVCTIGVKTLCLYGFNIWRLLICSPSARYHDQCLFHSHCWPIMKPHGPKYGPVKGPNMGPSWAQTWAHHGPKMDPK